MALSAVTDKLPEQYRTARELAVANLKGLESALRGLDNIDATEVVHITVEELQAKLNWRTRRKSLRRIAGRGWRKIATSAPHLAAKMKVP